ncbi:helix-turn-helix domain-containing protein [Kineococcus sp. T90]|nr:helix-turn-helix domain-containing protein [Kineococcus indalonis]
MDTRRIAPGERLEVVREAVWGHVVEVELEHHLPPERVQVLLGLSRLGRVGVCSVRATATTVHRTARLARRETEPAVFLGLQVSGSSLVVQHGREAVLRPGEFAVYDTCAPYTLVNPAGIDQHFFRVPRSALGVPGAVLRDVTAVTVGADNPVAGLAARCLTGLAEDRHLRSAPTARAVEEATLSLVRAALVGHLADGTAGRDVLQESLETRITSWLDAHLGDPGLSAQRVAAAHHISVRYLYVVLARCGISLGEWVRTQRLERCRAALEDPRSRTLPIGALARGWGFTDPGHFSRSFRQAYGCTPTQWRAEHTAP